MKQKKRNRIITDHMSLIETGCGEIEEKKRNRV
jgi:hypothetical protein